MQININQLTVIEILKFSKYIKEKSSLLSCLEELAQEYTKTLYESFITDSGKNPFVLVRFFNTCAYHNLPEDIQADIQYKEQKKRPLPEDRYLTLLGTYGDREEWRNRTNSKDHQAISLFDPNFQTNYPMLSSVFGQIGIELHLTSQIDMDILIKGRHEQLSVFCVENAVESSLIPKQSEFVVPFGIQSAFGFGGIYPTGNTYAIIIFSREKINKETARLFLSLNPAIKQITLPYEIREKVFNKSISLEKYNSDESTIKRFNENVDDNHKKYLIEREISAAVRAELEMTNEHMIALAEELKKSNENMKEAIAKRSHAEGALLESQRQLQSVLDNAPACIYIKDTQGKYVLINKQFEKLFHITREQIKGKTDFDVFPSEMADTFQKNDKKVLEINMPMEMEEIAPHDDGLHTYISIKFPLYTSHSVPYGLCGISTDISQRKKMEEELKKGNDFLEQCIAERTSELEGQNIKLVKEFERRKKTELALKESEKRFRVMFEQAAIGVALREVKTNKLILANKKYCDIIGYTIGEIKEKTLSQITYPEDISVKLDNLQQLIDGRIHEFAMEKRYFHKNGSVVWVNMTVSPMWKEGEKPDFYMVIVKDITERKKVIESLVDSNEKIQLLLNSTGEGIYGIDGSGLCTFVNASCIKLLGYENANQLIGKNMHKLIHHSYKDRTPFPIEECKVFQAFKKGESVHVADDIVWRSEGTYFPVEYTSYPIKKNNEILGAVVTFQDITVRKRMEEELLHSKKMQALGVISSGVAHEVNNILAAIDGNIQVLIRQNKGREQLLETLNVVHKYVRDGAEIVRSLNEFTREKKDSTKYVLIDLADMARHVVAFLKPRWQGVDEGVETKYNINTNELKHVRMIQGNPSELREVLLNIINNALDAMPDGGTLCILTWDDEETVYLSISDTGIGMPEDIKSKIFDPFFTSKERGTGLGLSVAYGIVKRHGGRINVSSTVGVGSTFLLSFPSSKDVKDVYVEEIIAKTGVKKGMRGNKILVVEDEAIIGKVLCNFLSEEGYVVEHVDDGKTALEKLKIEKYDLVICDLGMPEISGWDIMSAIELLDEKPKVGIITGFLNTSELFSEKEIKAHFIINKPFDLEEVLARIQTVFEGDR